MSHQRAEHCGSGDLAHRRHHCRRATAALVALGLTFTACGTDSPSGAAPTSAGGSSDSSTAEPASPADTDAAGTATSPGSTESTSTTDAPDSLDGKPAVDPQATTSTVPGPPLNPLTGTLLGDPATANRPALIVKIDNAPGARPQTGFNAADLVYEEIVNDNLTRFAMVFQSRGSDPVGPIRSGRIQDINLFGSLQRPLFSWSGGNATVTAAIRASDLIDIGPSRQNVYFRANDRRAPHNLYSNTTALWSKAPADVRAPIPQFSYRTDDETAGGTPSIGADLTLDAVNVSWRWDTASALYLRTMEGSSHMDRAGGQVSTNNVVVLVMNYLPGISGSPDAQTLGFGEAFVLTGGMAIHGKWTRTNRLQPFALEADDGTKIRLSPGRTFIELPRTGTTVILGP